MTNRIDRLETRGLVRRLPDKLDRRGVLVRLTSQGQKVIDTAIQCRLDAARNSLQALSPAEQKQLANLLRTVILSIRRQS